MSKARSNGAVRKGVPATRPNTFSFDARLAAALEVASRRERRTKTTLVELGLEPILRRRGLWPPDALQAYLEPLGFWPLDKLEAFLASGLPWPDVPEDLAS